MWTFPPSQRALAQSPGCWMRGVITKTHERRTPMNFGTKSKSEYLSLYGLISVQIAISGKQLHTNSDLKTAILNSATSP